jgi:hypothetical protein
MDKGRLEVTGHGMKKIYAMSVIILEWECRIHGSRGGHALTVFCKYIIRRFNEFLDSRFNDCG